MSFIAGQPLGYYGSWALFSLSHHFIVWLAAELSLSSKAPFTRYAVKNSRSFKDRFLDHSMLG